jgi:hypothetical protein
MPAKKKLVDGPVYRAVTLLTVGDKVFKPGDVVPEAASWPRVDSWVRARRIELVTD